MTNQGEKKCPLCGRPLEKDKKICDYCLGVAKAPNDVARLRKELLVDFPPLNESEETTAASSAEDESGGTSAGEKRKEKPEKFRPAFGVRKSETSEKQEFLAEELHKQAFDYLNRGKFAKAIELWERALEYDPEFDQARDYITKARQLIDEARETYRQKKPETRKKKKIRFSRVLLTTLILCAMFAAGYYYFREKINKIREEAETLDIKPKMERIEAVEVHGMVQIPAGSFPMGKPEDDPGASKDEKPKRSVYLNEYYMDKYEVTNSMYARFINERGLGEPGKQPWIDIRNPACKIRKFGNQFKAVPGYEDYPVVAVNWFGAMAFARWAGKRLPTEAEWEKAAGGTLGLNYPWGNEWEPNMANLEERNTQSPISETVPLEDISPYGLYHMAGNVMEWCADWYQDNYYSRGFGRNPQGPPQGKFKTKRGGSFKTSSYLSRNSHRGFASPREYAEDLGFRCASYQAPKRDIVDLETP